MSDSGLKICEQSRFFASPCFPAGAGPDYVNAALRVQTDSAAPDVLAILHRIEADYGRARGRRWGQRVLDLDLIALDDTVYPDPETYQLWCDLPLAEQMTRAPDSLILPHPRMQDRAFVLVPLAEVAPDWQHPITGETVAQMCDALPESEKSALRPL